MIKKATKKVAKKSSQSNSNNKLSIPQKKWLNDETLSWKKDNIINDYIRNKILDKYNVNSNKPKEKTDMDLVKLFYIFGSLILGFGFIILVAANWNYFPNMFKSILLLITSIVVLLLGYYFKFENKNYFKLGCALIFSSCLIYGSTIFQVANWFSLSANNSTLIAIWIFTSLLVAYFLKSTSSFILCSILLIIWNFYFQLDIYKLNYFYPLILGLIFIPLSKFELPKLIPNLIGLIIVSLGAIFYSDNHLLLVLNAILLLIYSLIIKYKYNDTNIFNLFFTLTSVIFTFWMIVFSFEFQQQKFLNLLYLIPFLLLIYLSIKFKSKVNIYVNLVSLLIWFNLFLTISFPDDSVNAPLMIIFNSLFGISCIVKSFYYEKYKIYKMFLPTVKPMKIIGTIITIFSLFILSNSKILSEFNQYSQYTFSYILIIFILALFISSIFLLFQKLKNNDKNILIIILILLIALLLSFTITKYIYALLILFNALSLISILFLIYYFVKIKNPSLFNLSLGLFVLWMLIKYFDLFWSMTNKGLFFIIGGILILGITIFIEKKGKKNIENE